jgi:hypothetical protein
MKGEVEIWQGDELLLKEPNMIVDGAGELLADIMTLSPSLSGIQNTATSAILDASNYIIQAISFGTGKDAYNANAHSMDPSKQDTIVNFLASRLNISGVVPIVSFVSSVENYTFPDFTYLPKAGLPVAPSPELTVLEPNIQMSSVVGGYYVSSVFPPNGQLTNFMPSAIFSSMMQNTVFSSTTSAIAVASLLGCFPDGSGVLPTDSRFNRYFIRRASETSVSPNIQAAGFVTVGGFFNAASSMDVSGFVNLVMSSVPRAGYSMSSTASGLCMSANSNFSSNGIVEYSVSLASGDVGFANMYGGIYHLGLWTIDMQRSLQNGNSPPFRFTQISNPRKYKLFCRKGLSKNLGFIQPAGGSNGEGNYRDLLIKWRLRFL